MRTDNLRQLPDRLSANRWFIFESTGMGYYVVITEYLYLYSLGFRPGRCGLAQGTRNLGERREPSTDFHPHLAL